MIEIKQFQADDGSRWDSAEEAMRRDLLQRRRRDVNAILGNDRPDSNGADYIQHKSEAVAQFTNYIGDLLREFESEKIAAMWRQEPRGFVGRYLDDGRSPFYADYRRLICIDSQSREWGQPYYANHPPPQARWRHSKPGSENDRATSGTLAKDEADALEEQNSGGEHGGNR